jgi:hypothetical protein
MILTLSRAHASIFHNTARGDRKNCKKHDEKDPEEERMTRIGVGIACCCSRSLTRRCNWGSWCSCRLGCCHWGHCHWGSCNRGFCTWSCCHWGRCNRLLQLGLGIRYAIGVHDDLQQLSFLLLAMLACLLLLS